MTHEQANPTFYDADSAAYDAKRWGSGAGAATNRAQQRIVAELTAHWKEASVLEVGSGTARFTIPLLQRGHSFTLLDISAQMLATARQNITHAGCAAQIKDYVNGSIYELPFGDSTFDHAMSLNVFNHLEHYEKALCELARVIRPGGTLLINYANLMSLYWPAGRRINKRQEAIGQKVFSTWVKPSVVRRQIAEAGLRVVKRLGHMHVPRAMERFHLHPLCQLVDSAVRRGPLAGLAPVHFVLSRKPESR